MMKRLNILDNLNPIVLRLFANTNHWTTKYTQILHGRVIFVVNFDQLLGALQTLVKIFNDLGKLN